MERPVSEVVEVRVVKRFRHPVERVFDAFVDETRVGEWLFATPGGAMEKADYDPRPGGGFEIWERRGEELARHWGEFVEIDRPRRIRFDFWVEEAPEDKTRVTVDFAAEGDGCTVTLSHDLAAAWAAYRDRSAQGWAMILDSLERTIDPMGGSFLDKLIGEWTFEGRSFPDDPQQRRTGTETVTRNGVWIVIEGSDDNRFQLAMDPATGRVTGDFVHWAYPRLWTYDGEVEADGRLHLRSRGPSFDGDGQETDYDDIWEVLSPDERRLTSRVVGPDGEWRDFCVTDYRRKV